MHLYSHNATLVADKYYIYRKWKMQAYQTELRLFRENVTDKKIIFMRSFTWEEIRNLLIF